MSIVQIGKSIVNAKVVTDDDAIKSIVQNALTYTVPEEARQGSKWDGRTSFFEWPTCKFPAGFTHLVRKELERAGHQVQIVSKPLPVPLGPEFPKVSEHPHDPRYDYQPETVERLLRRGQMIAQVATGGGKCLGKNTPVLMHDGTIKAVQDVRVGDFLMGPDSAPRTVLSICSGASQLYKVTPTKGDSYIVNDAHILSLKKTSRGFRGKHRNGEKYPKGEIVNVNVEDYLRETPTFRHVHKGWRTGVDFPKINLPVDPYLLGVILGDGSISGIVSVTSADPEIVATLEAQADLYGLNCKTFKKDGSKAIQYCLTNSASGGKLNPLMAKLRDLGFVSDDETAVKKFIPHSYKTSFKKDRLELLAGLLDTDGHYDGKCFYLTLKEEKLFDDALFVARSLGFAAYKKQVKKTCCNNGVVGDYFSMVISGHIDQIPTRISRKKATSRLQKKDVLVTGLTVEPAGFGEYFGFEIDGDKLFLLGDFTVTHNTEIANLATARIKRKTLFLTTRKVLMYQMRKAFTKAMRLRALAGERDLIGQKIGVVGDGLWRPGNEADLINVGMVQTIALRLKSSDSAEVQETLDFLAGIEFVILEEAHEAASDSFYEVMRRCTSAAYRLALTATPFMKDNEEDNMRLMACTGAIGIHITEKELIDKGILAEPFFVTLKTDYEPDSGAIERMATKAAAKTSMLSTRLGWTTDFQRATSLGIVHNKARNRAIVNQCLLGKKHGLPVIVLVMAKKHGHILEWDMQAAGLKVEYIQGEDDHENREKALTALANSDIDVLIGTTIIDVGVDVPSVGMVILAGGGKAETTLRQRIGRGLRAKKKGANVCVIVDFEDKVNKHLYRHYETRRQIIESTPGFFERLLKPGSQFPFQRYFPVLTSDQA